MVPITYTNTNGSWRNGLAGAGFYCECPHLEASIFTGSTATVYQAELFAMSELCESKSFSDATNKCIYICTDSQSAIETICSPIVDSLTVRNCKAILNKIGSSNKVIFLWVRGHKGITGNEIADVLAHSGTNNSFIGPEPRLGRTKTMRKCAIDNWLIKQHAKTWSNYDGAKHTKIFCKSPSTEFTNRLLNLDRPNIKGTVEAIKNHCGLNKHLFYISIKYSPKCLRIWQWNRCNHHLRLHQIPAQKNHVSGQTRTGATRTEYSRSRSGEIYNFSQTNEYIWLKSCD